MATPIEALNKRLAGVNALGAALGLMSWDQQTHMPSGGAPARAQHMGQLGRMVHEMFVAEETQSLLAQAEEETDPESLDGALLRNVRRGMDLATKVPSALVERKTFLGAQGHEVWVEARMANDFARFLPVLEEMFQISRQEADCLGFAEHPYDALLDRYEQDAKASDVRTMFEELKAFTVPLLREIQASSVKVDNSLLEGEWPVDRQRTFTERLAKEVGYDFSRGRQDEAPHPFCSGWSIGDVRITTRYLRRLDSAIFSTLHECGHAMYEQGSPMEWDLTPLAGGVSLGVHESQSRLWENIVGRSLPFWERFLPELQELFPGMAGVDAERFYRMINMVEPSLIRVEADELTYNLHILVRFELECDLLTGELAIKDLPSAWNAKFEAYLGIVPPSDSDGCLQDVHWSGGMVGYFPTYTMGNLLSHQIWQTLRKDLGDTDALIREGKFDAIHGWLTERIYAQGSRYTPADLVRRVTGKPMAATDYCEGMRAKFGHLYAL
jgi:carboxypeptidase Taq